MIGLDVPVLLHKLDLFLRPLVERQALHFRDMGPNLAMDACTIHANEYTNVKRSPSRGTSFTVCADIVPRYRDKLHENATIPLCRDLADARRHPCAKYCPVVGVGQLDLN